MMRSFLQPKTFTAPALVLSLATAPALVQAQSGQTESAPETSGSATENAAVRYRSAGEQMQAALNREIGRMNAEQEMIAWFFSWQHYLETVARTDPEAALRQRLPMATCQASLLAPICDDLTVLFAPDPDQP